jgi:chromosomal replication initiator protein
LDSGVFSLAFGDALQGGRSFIAGPENAVARVVQHAVMQQDCSRMPLVLWGATGVGKTYLAEGLAETWRKQGKEKSRKVIQYTGVEFARHYADAVDTDSLTSFRQSFRSAGLIIIDHVSPLCDKPAATREFCYLLDRWLQQEQLVLCTSSVAPSLLPEAALASRLCGGLSLCLAPPELPTQRALLSYFTQTKNLPWSAELLDHLATQLAATASQSLTPRELQAAILRLEAAVECNHCELNFAIIDATFPNSQATRTPIQLKQILTLVARKFGVTLTELRSSSRRQSLVRARGVVALLARQMAGESYQAIGAALGNRDHSTIHHAVEKVQQSLQTDVPFASFLQHLQEELIQSQTPSSRSKTKSRLGKPVAPLLANVSLPHVLDKPFSKLS